MTGSSPTLIASLFEIIQTNQPGWTITWEGNVQYIAHDHPPATPNSNQLLNVGDALQTLALSRAVVRLRDWSQLRLKDRTRLEIQQRADTTSWPELKLQEGQIYFSSRGGAQAIVVETPHARGVPKGTEFLVRVNAAGSEVTMFDGEVELSNGVDRKSVRSGEQGIAVPGQPIQVRPIIQAQNIVQWWIYYPAIMDPDDLNLPPAALNVLDKSLTAYRRGNLAEALEMYPGYPSPADPGSESQRLYLAALYLSVGAVNQAERLLTSVAEENPLRRALRIMSEAVAPSLVSQDDDVGLAREDAPTHAITTSEQLAISYDYQSRHDLASARKAARAATQSGAHWGFAWARLAELEFGFGRTRAARDAVERALMLSPENAQAHAVRGFLLAAQYRFPEAIRSFDIAISLDPALGNAWLGRGLVARRQGFNGFSSRPKPAPNDAPDWMNDLQTAAALEPRRSLVRSYTGKAFSDLGLTRLAEKELDYARQLDPNDPTPWLYSALEHYQNNRGNAAVEALRRSMQLNDNRAVYRSRFLLDQDNAVRSASLAKIYQSIGLNEVALREASRAVSDDYANHSAHQFLAESFNVLRDPARFNLRYETVWFNELLLANILSPLGAGLLSQNISQQEYSRLLQENRIGFLTSSEYRSDERLRQIASHYGLLGRSSYTLDLDYAHHSGSRPNNDLDRIEWYSQFKHQMNDRDSIFLLTKYQDYESGDNIQVYDPDLASRQLRLEEKQAPILLGAIHREWNPGSHTTILGGWLQNDVRLRSEGGALDVWTNSPPPGIDWARFQDFDRSRDRREFDAWTAELNQVLESSQHVTVAGARFQGGRFEAGNSLIELDSQNVQSRFDTPVRTEIDEPFHRISVYAYHTLKLISDLRLTAGLVYDHIDSPANLQLPPLSDDRESDDAFLPKAALQWDPHRNLTVRGVYAETVGGLTFDDSIRLEPTQLAGFPQAFRSVISESEVGSVLIPEYKIAGLALDTKFDTGTFMGVQGQWIGSEVDQVMGIFRGESGLGPPPPTLPSSTKEELRYDEYSLRISLDQMLGQGWTVGASYQATYSRLDWAYPEIPSRLPLSPDREEEAILHRFGLRAHFEHSSGFFADAQSGWFIQQNRGYGDTIYAGERPDDSVFQLDLLAGFRFLRRRGELTVGCLNVTDADYRLNSLTPYAELPRERVWMGRFKLEF